jgi:hypothetical protein
MAKRDEGEYYQKTKENKDQYKGLDSGGRYSKYAITTFQVV